MGRIIGKAQYRDILLGAGLMWAALALVLWPEQSMGAMRDGIKLCGNVILPSLFPFFVLSSLVVELGMSRYLGRLLEPVMAPLFCVNGNCAAALALGFVGGYPVGARTAIQIYENGQCTRTEAERMLAFCNNCGPAFILGVVGAGIFGSGAAGLLLYLTHLLASLCVGVLFRFYKAQDRPQRSRAGTPQFQAVSFSKAFTSSVTGSLQSTLNICAFILFFSVFLRILAHSGILDTLGHLLSLLLAPLGMDQTWAERLLTGLVEVSSGVSSLTDGSLPGRLSMAAFMLGWAGVSVHCQVLAFLGDSGLSVRTYVTGKLLHGVLSAALTSLLLRVCPLSSPASFYLAEQTQAIAQLDFQQALTLSAAAAWGMWLFFLALTVYVVQKNSGKKQRSVV
ncbi:sporulation protein [Pseudoflavonifractor sp. 60]|uniref:nucleoside recognition domain-containing protein n=1 Tax=Pseudoflavonifractor sp. 60 TaxID=2304576 RepID=UPI00136F54AF|nr:nucleoside recognition domain-containing protein [Pseudoflavonifractor sp. 60]NBI65214.1 sporulation protein [Pseudoflavonifractor sp. 60]